MCGLAGLYLRSGGRLDELEARVRRMIGAIVHRGPDDSGIWTDSAAGVGLGFRRLSIIDLSPAGHQPMTSATGRYTAVFNGEIYNFRSLRRELEADRVAFRGHSDTEVMLAAFDKWGIRSTLPRLTGMFAIAVWDSAERTLTLIRDRLGKKPLFYHRAPGDGVMFAQELKSFCADPAFPRRLDPDALALYFRYLYIPAPRCIYRDTWKLPPGHFLTIRDPLAPLPAPEPYWRLADLPDRAALSRTGLDERELTDELEALLKDAVRSRLESDVPLGALLSGGIDSSTVVALMQAGSGHPVRTYTIGFDVAEHDESSHAEAVARHLGTAHTSLRVSGREALDVVPSLPDILDEPLADPSVIPTYLVSKLARQEVTVALTGDGGDEVFAGYNRYRFGARMIRAARAMPGPLRSLAAGGLSTVGVARWDRAHRAVAGVWPGVRRVRFAGEKAQKAANLLREPTPAQQYRSLLSAWQRPDQLLAGHVGNDDAEFEAAFSRASGLTLEERMMLVDQGHYLPDDLLAKVDRASMAVSLEARVPLLDHRVVEYGWRLPLEYKLREGASKWLLRQVLYRHVPRGLVERPKVGFSVPVAEWLRGPLAGWGGSLLGPPSTGVPGAIDRDESTRAWNELQAGRKNQGLPVWAVLGFLAWQERWKALP